MCSHELRSNLSCVLDKVGQSFIANLQTVTVSPFCGNSDICPQDDYILTVLQIQVTSDSVAPGG